MAAVTLTYHGLNLPPKYDLTNILKNSTAGLYSTNTSSSYTYTIKSAFGSRSIYYINCFSDKAHPIYIHSNANANPGGGTSGTSGFINASVLASYYGVSVQYNKNDGSGATANQIFRTWDSHKQFGYTADGKPAWSQTGQFGQWDRDGYTLLGWSTNANATKATFTPYNNVTNNWIQQNYSSVVKLYAVWKKNEPDVYAKYNGLWQKCEVKTMYGGLWRDGKLKTKTQSGWTE